MFDVPSISDLNIVATLPVTLLALGACVFMLFDVFIPHERKHWTAIMAAAGISFSLLLSLLSLAGVIEFGDEPTAFFGMYIVDAFTDVVNVTVLITALLGIMVSYNYLDRTNMQRGEYYYLLMLTTVGVMLMGSAGDLVMVFVALELLSIPLYILSGFRRPQEESEESAIKYFILGAFASAFLVYGVALVYGAVGTTNLQEIWDEVNRVVAEDSSAQYLLLIGAGLVIVGLGFKVAAVPFHMWTPDVYQGAPTSVVAYMSVAAKVGGFAAAVRVLGMGLSNFSLDGGSVAAWQDSIWLISILTMLLGNLVAVSQYNLKRLLAYSSIAHAGYVLLAVAAAGSAGVGDEAAQAVLIYMIAYAFTNIGAFSVIIAVEKDDASNTDLDSMKGLARTQPLLAAAMALFMLSLTGIPLTAGFIGKWFVFKAALSADLVPAAIVGVLTSLVSAFYYLRVVWLMYFEEGEGEAHIPWPLASGIAIAALGTLVLGLVPYLASEMAHKVTLAFGG